MSDTITERVAEMKSDESKKDPEVRQIAHSIVVEDHTVYVETLKDNRFRIGTLRHLAKNSFEDIKKDFEDENKVIISGDVTSRLQELIFSVKQAWDTDINMFRLDYNLNKHGQIHDFYVPFNSDLVENVRVFQVYDENGDFVADEIERKIGKDITKLETSELYIPKMPTSRRGLDVYEKERATEEEMYKEALESNTDSETTNEAIISWMKSFVALSAMLSIVSLTSISVYWLTLVIVVFPGIVFNTLMIPVSIAYSILYSKRQKRAISTSKLFKTTNSI